MIKAPDFNEHVLVPKHEKLSEAEGKKLLEKISLIQLPTILAEDPAITSLKVEKDQIIKITRKGSTSGETIFYRRVI